MERWLEGATLKGCSQSGNGTMTCRLIDASGQTAQIEWNSTGPKSASLEKPFTLATDIYGNSVPVTRTFTIGYSPVLLTAK
jgi:hypothetical protein